MSAKNSAEFHANHIRLPLPGTASDVLAGPLPGTDRQGDLAWLEFSSAVDMQRNYTAVVVETPTELPSAWVDADDVTVPGFGEGLPRAALELAREHGLGLSTHGRKACVYLAAPVGREAGRAAPQSRPSCRTRWRLPTRWARANSALAEPVPGLRVQLLGERQHLGRFDPEHGPGILACAEAAIANLEVPDAAVLRLTGVGEPLQSIVVGDWTAIPSTTTSRP